MKLLLVLFIFIFTIQAEEEKPDVMQVLFLKLGIKSLSNEISSTKEQSSVNSKKLDGIENRLDNIEKNMEVLLSFINSHEVVKSNENSALGKFIENSEKDSDTLYSIQLFTAKKKKSIKNFFLKLPLEIRAKTRVFSINDYLVIRYGAEKLKENLYDSIRKIKDSGMKDIFIVRISQKSWSNSTALEH